MVESVAADKPHRRALLFAVIIGVLLSGAAFNVFRVARDASDTGIDGMVISAHRNPGELDS